MKPTRREVIEAKHALDSGVTATAERVIGQWQDHDRQVKMGRDIDTIARLLSADADGGGWWEGADDARSGAQLKRAIEASKRPDYKRAWINWIRGSLQVRDEFKALDGLAGDEQKALTEGSDTAGGFLVPEDVSQDIFARLTQKSHFRKYATVKTTSRDVYVEPRIVENTTKGSIYSSDWVALWSGETPAATDIDAKWGQLSIRIKKLRAFTRLSNDLVSDAIHDPIGYLAQDGALNMAVIEDLGFASGVGDALHPIGLLNGGVTTVDVTGSTATTISNTTGAAGSMPKILDLIYALPSQYMDAARWLLANITEKSIRKLVDGQGRYMWPLPEPTDQDGNRPRLLGFPASSNDAVPLEGTAGNKVLIFGDLRGYMIADRGVITSTVLRERFAETDQIGIILTHRTSGTVANPDAFRIGVL